MTLSPTQVADRLEIADVVVRYTHAIDTKRWDLLDEVFTPDARLDYRASGGPAGGYPEVRRWLEAALAQFAMTQHVLGQSLVELGPDSDTARSRTLFYNPMGMTAGSVDFWIGGAYDDELVRTTDGWRIASKLEEQHWFSGTLPDGLVLPPS